MAATVVAPAFETVADLLERLGDVPPGRVRLHPAPGTATVADVVTIEAREDRLFELVDGVLVEKGMGFHESRVALILGHFLEDYLEEHDLGIVAGADGMVRLDPTQVRIPDVSFLSWDRLPGRVVPRKPVPEVAPDLAVEVLNASNTPMEMARKLRESFAAGVRLVQYVDPEARSVTVHRSPEAAVVLGVADTLDGGDVLPGFTLGIGAWFARVDRGLLGRP